MNEQTVKSSWIKDVTSTGQHATMTTNKGDSYQILDIGSEAVEEWLNAPSKGKYYAQHIKNQFTINRIG